MARLAVVGLKELLQVIAENKSRYTTIFVKYYGDYDDHGLSWCPDCVKAEPIIDKIFSELKDNVLLVSCAVGDRPKWKDQENEFRKHEIIQLKSIPTLIEWGTVRYFT
ncbi:uncharacterized protein TRIADDRAFT_61314 [Trichoplax adhaerens]|uniref:Thioredoxin domain-containing protein 17 n=1 Tax=Trichoplax adhaerens TaxID=10228 RepID=B3SAM7_TRIAD|nr:hypothetical protein TRIADDRAFT_61314 [Trichoplax adhaerens]EDV20130.1 hypothetical protein TRIADDRAFT_61314 [Trichoplax adhaerens]|eukprot:XP_002117291.1 hypothetical protein TRIADDRAFT_61314 [Trichoplax adhaerens]